MPSCNLCDPDPASVLSVVAKPYCILQAQHPRTVRPEKRNVGDHLLAAGVCRLRARKEFVWGLLLVRQCLDARALLAAGAPVAGALPHLPEEIWLAALGFLRSGDVLP